MPSFTSGLYPTEHGVNQKLLKHGSAAFDEVPRLISENSNVGINSETSWVTKPSHKKPVLETHHIREESTLDEMESPFFYLEHDKGAHSPYGIPFKERDDDRSFWRGKENEGLRRAYQRGVKHSTERFVARIEYLREEGLLEETLVVFLSDHGELLGESKYGGFFGHKTPIAPEIVEVPVVFIGAGLPEGEEFDTVVSGVDIAPTALAAQGHEVEDLFHGVDLWNRSSDIDRRVFAETRKPIFLNFVPDRIPQYEAVSVWDANGGYVHHLNSLLIRFLSCQYGKLVENEQANITRQNFSLSNYQSLLRKFCKQTVQYGNPGFEWDDSLVKA
jgi:hypothetical protein